jgi:hypothetical protein
VGLKLVGSNVVVQVQFTPYPNFSAPGNAVLVAQVQIWINIPDEGIRYQTTMQTIPLKYGEQIYFFPLGSMSTQDDARIEIQLELRPYAGKENEAVGENTAPAPSASAVPSAPLPPQNQTAPKASGNEVNR